MGVHLFLVVGTFFLEDIYSIKCCRSFIFVGKKKANFNLLCSFRGWLGTEAHYLAVATFYFDMVTALW